MHDRRHWPADNLLGRHLVDGSPSARRPADRGLLQSLCRPANIVFAVVLVAVVSVWWVALRPTAFLGGPATFITVKGTSMLPTLKTGDFVLAEAQPTYRVGDLVVYRMPKGQIGAGDDLIHRIVAGNATTGFTLKGDSNPAPDPWIVPRSDRPREGGPARPRPGQLAPRHPEPALRGTGGRPHRDMAGDQPPRMDAPPEAAHRRGRGDPSAGPVGRVRPPRREP
jgi:signal peptidase I